MTTEGWVDRPIPSQTSTPTKYNRRLAAPQHLMYPLHSPHIIQHRSFSQQKPQAMSRDQQNDQAAAASKSLPARLTVPPLPPRIHRRLELSATADGLLVRAAGNGPSSDAVLVRWGPRGAVEPVNAAVYADDEGTSVELGGVLGIVRLWDGMSPRLGIADLSSRLPRHLPPPGQDPHTVVPQRRPLRYRGRGTRSALARRCARCAPRARPRSRPARALCFHPGALGV